MKETIKPIDKKILIEELSKDKLQRKTNNGNREIYIVNAHNAPHTMQEIGRLREISFRDAGGGTGESVDIDEFDTIEIPYEQLIVWDPNDLEIIGGYRFLHGKHAKFDSNGQPILATSHMFHFSDEFIKNYLPYTIELGRSFVQPAYQPTFNIRKGMYSLDNLWDGLGALIIDTESLRYYFGKITMYPRFNICARDLILYFLKKYFRDKEKLVQPINALNFKTDLKKLENTFYGADFKEDYKILVQEVRRLKENIPPLVNAYMNLSASMKFFGTAVNHEFGEVEESAILIDVFDIYDVKKDRHVSSYKKEQ